MPWQLPGSAGYLDGDIWPLPEHAYAHPRSAATFARFFAQYVRTGQASLAEGIRKASLIPAQILQDSTPRMAYKGRLQTGCDADIVVFDPDRFQDNATFDRPAQPSTGMVHVLVGGTPVITDTTLDTQAFPGKPVRRPITHSDRKG